LREDQGLLITKKADYIWMNGEIVPWDEAKIHVATDAVLRGENVFEGIRAYWNEDEQELYIFRNDEHLRRLRQSAKVMRMRIPYSDEELTRASIELLRRNNFANTVHFRPVVYLAGDWANYDPDTYEVGVFIMAANSPHDPSIFSGIKSCISTWRRSSDLASPSRIKAGPNYHNSRLATVEAKLNGFGTPLMLNERGKVAESPGSCFFMVRDGVPITPPVTADILESITRSTLIQLFADELGTPVHEREIDRSEVYVADEAFFCGSGHEIEPIISVDHYPLGDGAVGPLTRRIQSLYFEVVQGRAPRYRHWLTPVYRRAAVGAGLGGSLRDRSR
jgi:branched-chain amino acid aminotransferase